MSNRYTHPYHLVVNSPWPITSSITLYTLLIGNIMLLNNKLYGKYLVIGSLISIFITATLWREEVIIEGTMRGEHTKIVQKNIMMGFILFIISEAILFGSFFYAFFHNALVPSIEIGGIYPPMGIETLDYKSVPLLNTAILFFSGISVTAAQHSLDNKAKNNTINWLFITILLGIIFTSLQYFEYFNASFSIFDGIFGTNFYSLTGLHAIHMIISTSFLSIVFFRLILNHYTSYHHLAFSQSAIYLHFCDYVWLVLFAIVYIWGSY